MHLKDLRTFITEAPMPPNPIWFNPFKLPDDPGDDWSPMDGFEWVPVGDGYWQLVGPDGMPVGPPVPFPEGVDPNVDDGDPDYKPGNPSEISPIPAGYPTFQDGRIVDSEGNPIGTGGGLGGGVDIVPDGGGGGGIIPTPWGIPLIIPNLPGVGDDIIRPLLPMIP